MKKIYRICRRTAAVLLVMCLMTGIIGQNGVLGGMAAYASTELPSKDLGKTGRSDDLAYNWIHGRDYDSGANYWGGHSYRYNLRGLKAGETNFDNASMRITYQDFGFPTFLTMAGNDRTLPPRKNDINNLPSYDPTQKLPGGSGGTPGGYFMAKLGQRDENGNKIANLNAIPAPYYNGAVEQITFGDGSAENPQIKVETRITTTPSLDGKYVIVDYYVAHVGGDLPQAGRSFWLASPFDLEVGGITVGGGLIKDVIKTSRGFYALNTNTKSTVDVITMDSRLGITDDVDTKWVGNYADRVKEMMIDSALDVIEAGDNSLAYSWEFLLRPNEIVHRRMAFANKEAAYYVSWSRGSNSNDGTYRKPFKTIDQALFQCNGKNAYIFIQDYEPIDQTISLNKSFTPNTTVTFSSSDMSISGESLVDKADYIQPLTRAAGFTGPLFSYSGSAKIQFTDITLDGNNVAGADSLIRSTSGTIEINSGTTMKNSTGGALDFSGSANLNMNGAEIGTEIINNQSEKGAVAFSGSGNFTVINNVKIKDNKKTDGTQANVYLGTGNKILVDGELGSSSIGVTTQTQPASSPEGSTSAADQEIPVAVPTANYPDAGQSCPFADNFFADLSSQGMNTGTGNQTLGNGKNTVMRRNGYGITRLYLNSSTGGSIPGAPSFPPVYYGPGDSVTIAAPGTIPGYELKNVIISQGSGNSLVYNSNAGADYGKITGTMPAVEVTVEYEYEKVNSAIIFESNGGTPQPPQLTGTSGSAVNAALPNISRYGYLFLYWSKNNDWSNPDVINALPSVFPQDPITYYAVYEPDPNVRFNYTVEYVNQSGDITFQTTTSENAFSVETPIEEQMKPVRNYVWSLADSGTSPSEFNYSGTVVPVGQFNGSDGKFTGKMPAQDLAVRYGYRVKTEDANATSGLKIRHETASGTMVSTGQNTQHFPEENITFRPAETYGYECTGYQIIKGQDEGDTSEGFVYPLAGTFGDAYEFTGRMPNQDVEILYLYEPTIEGFTLTVKYEDNNTQDGNLKNIIPPLLYTGHQADSPVGTDCHEGNHQREGVYQEQYGYQTAAHQETPLNSFSWSGNDFSGRMPNDNGIIRYVHNREMSKWADITYKPGINGSLSGGNGVSPDVQPAANGTYKASVLINDGSDLGMEKAYTLEQIIQKRLTPAPVADQYYRFAGWFVDVNGNGIMDNGETLLAQNHQFAGAAVLTAHFEEDPEKWITVYFAAGSHGLLNPGEPESLHVTYDKTWGDILNRLPLYTPEVNYLAEDWYADDTAMENTMILKKNQTYTVRFYPDPGIFGTDVRTPDVSAGLNSQGKGRITGFGTTLGYKYILTSLEGKILAVNKGNSLSYRTVFNDLYPGMRYKVFEATGTTEVTVGGQIEDVTGTVSDPAVILTPVVEYNYQIYYDEEEEGKTQLFIKPADPASDYALLDDEGRVVHTPQTGNGGWQATAGSPATVSFTGLDYNKEYIVVARPKGQTGITAESRKDDGSIIVTIPGGELELTNYIVETINGMVKTVGDLAVETNRYEETHKDDRVTVKAEPFNENGEPFSHWVFTIGSIAGMDGKLTQKEVSFNMPDTNLVMTAMYRRTPASPSNATVIDEVRGGSREEIALNPNAVPGLEEAFTTAADEILMDVNRADVTYKVVYQKGSVRASESNAIKASGSYNMDHVNAFTAAWSLDVLVERYVNGRKVTRGQRSEEPIPTYIQLEKGHVDMMDYQLYEIGTDSDGETTVSIVPLEYDPETTGGLFTFDAREGMRYIMVYNRAYRVYFLNQVVMPVESRYRYYFKVRKDEAPSDSYYSMEYGQVEEQTEYFVSPTGAEYRYLGWSYNQSKYREFDPDRRIQRKTYLYAFYKDNEQEIDDARDRLEEAIRKAIELSDDYFLKLAESKELKEAIKEAQEVLDRENPRASISQLEEAIEKLKEKTDPYVEVLKDRYDDYQDQQDNGNKGGGKGGGGSGSGSKANPISGNTPKSFTLGVHGIWVEVSNQPGKEREMSFVLTGGLPLYDMWAWIKYPVDEYGRESDATGWYFFNDKGIMVTGWFKDVNGYWYYSNTETEGNFGKMTQGWRLDATDGNWYYFDPRSGAMLTGWRTMGGQWYYFEEAGSGSYVFDTSKNRWIFSGAGGHPLGAMYRNEMTPDGHKVDENGVWIP